MPQGPPGYKFGKKNSTLAMVIKTVNYPNAEWNQNGLGYRMNIFSIRK